MEVFDAEALAALHGLRATLDLRTDPSHRIYILLDNQAAVNCLCGRPSETSQEVFLEFQRIVREEGNIAVKWLPGHTDIPGNDLADGLANLGVKIVTPSDNPPSPQDRGMATSRTITRG